MSNENTPYINKVPSEILDKVSDTVRDAATALPLEQELHALGIAATIDMFKTSRNEKEASDVAKALGHNILSLLNATVKPENRRKALRSLGEIYASAAWRTGTDKERADMLEEVDHARRTSQKRTVVFKRGQHYLVSTIFAVDAGAWETMVFKCDAAGVTENGHDYDCARYDTQEEAYAGHEEMAATWSDAAV